jgi:putative transposase
MTRYIDAHKDQFGVEPICSVLEIAPSTYYAAASRPPCARQPRDEALKPERPIAGEMTFTFGRLKRS